MKNLAVIAACFLGFTATASSAASVNLEYYQDYEARFLSVCSRVSAAADCQRAMEKLQAELGFERFAEMVMESREETIVAALLQR